MVDEEAFHTAWESVGWDTQNPHAEDGQRKFIRAYEAAKSKEQPVMSVHELVENSIKERGYSGLCSAHKYGEDKKCKICYLDKTSEQPVEASGECWNAFEVWASKNGYPLDQSGFNGQHYASAGTQCAWEGWQASWNTRPMRESGIDAVANELRQKMINILSRHKKILKDALKFYSRHEHWMEIAPDSLRTSFVAMQGDGDQHGWRVAEDALTDIEDGTDK